MDPKSTRRELAGGVLRSSPKTGLVFAIREGWIFLSLVFYTPAVKTKCHTLWPTPATYHRPLHDHIDSRVG